MQLTKTFQHKCTRMSCTEQQLRIVHLQEVGHVLRPKNKLMNTGHRKVEFPDTLLICKMAIFGWRKQLSKLAMNFILMRIPAMILAQHANEDEDVDMDVVAEEEELHHVTRQCNPWYHPRLKPKLYQPINPNPSPSCTTPSGHTHRYG